MRLTSSRQELASKLALVGRAASSKSTIQILSHVLVTAGPDGVELAATDMELSLRVPLEADVAEGGSVAIPRLAGDIVRTMSDGEVAVEHRANEGVTTVSGGRSSFSLNCMQAADFPELPGAADGGALTIPTANLVETAERVVKAASRDETRPVLTGVLVSHGPDGLTMVATDSYRLAVKRSSLEGTPAEVSEAIVPARALAELGRLAAATKADTTEIVIAGGQAQFRLGGVVLTTRLIDGQFPDHRQLIPDTFEHEVVFDRGELGAVLARIAVLAQRNSPVRLAFDEGKVTISTISEQVGEGREEIPIAFTGEPMDVGFNVEFLRAGVESIDGDEVRFGVISPLRPGLLSGTDDDYRYLLMPIRLNA